MERAAGRHAAFAQTNRPLASTRVLRQQVFRLAVAIAAAITMAISVHRGRRAECIPTLSQPARPSRRRLTLFVRPRRQPCCSSSRRHPKAKIPTNRVALSQHAPLPPLTLITPDFAASMIDAGRLMESINGRSWRRGDRAVDLHLDRLEN